MVVGFFFFQGFSHFTLEDRLQFHPILLFAASPFSRHSQVSCLNACIRHSLFCMVSITVWYKKGLKEKEKEKEKRDDDFTSLMGPNLPVEIIKKGRDMY